MKYRSGVLKLALFATGLSGIVAEYILSTLATYFLGDSVFQWTMIVSIMLFSMGLGSRLSKEIRTHLLLSFIGIEFLLSLLVSFSTVIAYSVFAAFEGNALTLYGMSILIGVLIGMEIPLVIRLNKKFEELRINVSSVMEKDYYGSLVGGMFFAFIGLPYLGLTYTPFILGTINFCVACALIVILYPSLQEKNLKAKLISASAAVAVMLISGFFVSTNVVERGEASRYRDPVVYTEQSRYQKIVITRDRQDFWLFLNGNQQLSSRDEIMYHEPLVHPGMVVARHPGSVLVLGGGDGGAVREVLKYPSVKEITLVDLDPSVTALGLTHPLLLQMNDSALHDQRVEIVNADGYTFLESTDRYFDVIIVDLPDPKTVEIGRLYTLEFYSLCRKRLTGKGVLVTQAGSPYYAAEAFLSIQKTMTAAGFGTVPLHNQVTTLGEWGWILGSKDLTSEGILRNLHHADLSGIPTKWINTDALKMITSFGKPVFPIDSSAVDINRIHDPVLYRYYLDGRWDIY